MFVNKRMTPNPKTITSTTTIAEASEIMRTQKIRRLPVIDKGKLSGIVTDRDLREVSPSSATTLSIFELNYLLAKMQVKDIMKKDVITINEQATIEEAALILYTNRIGGLVVVDENHKVVGVITETDIFKCFVDVMGLPEGKTRLTLHVSDKLGLLHDVSGVFKEMGINIGSIVSYRLPNGSEAKIEMIIRADVPDIEALSKKLATMGYSVLHVAQIG